VANRDRVVRASEIGEYVYCARAWWLGAVQNRPSINQRELAQGERDHRRHGQGVRLAQRVERLAVGLLVAALLLGVWWVLSR